MFRIWLTFFLTFAVALSALADLPPTCAGQNVSRYMHTGQPNDAPPDKIYRFTDLRASILQEIERPNPNRCVIDFYKSAVNEESNYWARAIQPGCTVNNRGEITGTCSRKSEAVRSTRFVSSLDQELRGRLGSRIDAAEADDDDNTGDPNCPERRGPASSPQLTAQQVKDYFCCGDRNMNGNVNGQEPSREQQGMVRLTVLPWNYPIRDKLNYNECINKIRPRAVTAGTAATCVGSALQGALKIIWESISSIWKLPGVVWGLKTQIAALWRDRDPVTGQGGYRAKFKKNIGDAIMHFVTDKVNAIGKCLNNPERINLVCRFAGEIISTLVLPESLGMLFGLASKTAVAGAGLISRGLSATARGQRTLNGLGKISRGAAAVGRAGVAGARATGRVVDRATLGGAGATVRGVRNVAGRGEGLRQAVVVRPLARAGMAAVNRARSGASFASKFAAAARRERQFSEAAGAADAGLAGGAGRPRPVTIDNATGRPVDPRSVPPDESLKVVRSSTADRPAAGGVVRAGEEQGGAVVARTEPNAPRVEPAAARTEPARLEGPAPQARIEGPTPVARIEGPAPQARIGGPSPAARVVDSSTSDVPTLRRLPAPPAQRLLPAPTRVADAAADARVVPRAANTSVATNVATDARAATTNIRATGSATLDTRAPLRPTNVTVNYAQAAPSAPGPRLGSGGGGGGANVFTGGSGVAAESGLASRAGLNTGSTSKLVFVDGSTGAARPASVGRTGSAGNTSVGGGARAAAVDEGGGAAVGRASNNSSQSSGSVGRTEGTGSAVANETPVRFGFEKPPARENGAPSSAESSAFADRPANAKISPERVNKRLAEADRQALDDLELPSLTGRDAKFKPKSRFDDVESKDLKDRGPRVSEARETRIEVEDRLARLNPETREKVINHLKEIPADRAHVRDSDFAAILNSKNPAATIDRLKLASTGPAGRTQAISKLDIEIGKRTRQLKVTSITRETKLITAQERSALLIERTLIEYGETIRVRNIYSANTHNRYYDLQKGYEPHSLEDTFNVDIEVVGEGNFVVRGSYATETAWSAPDGGYYTFYRKKGYLDRDISRDVLASPADVTLPVSEQGISRFTSYEAKPGEQFSLGQNGPVRYNKEGQSITGSGGDGGSIELFCSRSPNCVKFENISDSVRTPTCRAGTPACDQIFKIQEDSRFAAVIEQPNPAAVLAEQRGKTQKIIRDMETEHDSLVAELAKPDFDLIQARSKHPELVSAFNLEREISVKTNRLRGGGLGPRKLDSDTKALYDLEVGTNRTIQDIELSIPGGDKKSGFTNVQKVTKQEQIRSGIAETISRSDGAYRLREVDTKIRDTQARLSTVRDVAERRKIATDLIRYSEERSDILLSYKRIEEAVKSKIGGIKYLDDTAKTALLDDALTRLKVVREPLAPFVARAEKAAPAVPPTSGVGARGPPQGPLRVLDDAPSYSNEIELLAKRDGVTARDFTEPQIESYSRDLRIPNRNMAADIEYKPIATKRDLDSVVAKALPDANIDTDRLRRMMSYRPQSGYLSGADFAEARKFTLAVQERGLANLERLPLSKFERETLNKVMDRAPLYGRQIDADIPKLGRLSTEAQVQSNAVAEAAAAAKKAEFDARVARAEARLKPREPTVSEQAPSYINEIELLAKRDGVSALNVTERQIDAYAADLRITNRNMAGAIEYKPIATKRDLDATIAKALPDAGIDTDRLRRMMSYRPQSGYLSGADFAEARKFVQAVDARGVSTLDRLPLSKFERETLNRVIDRAPMYARQIDVDVPKLGRLSTEAQVTTDVAGDAARAAAKADFDARVARAETALNRSTANAVVPEKAPSYANEIEVLAKRDGVSAVNLNERQIQGYADDLRITNRNMAGAMEYKPVVTRRDMQSMIEKVVPEGIKVDAERLRRMMSYRPQSGYLNGADFAEAKKFMQAVEARGGPVALDQLPFTQFERQNLNKIMDRAPMYARQGDPLLPAKMGRLNPDPAAVVMPAQRAERFVADFEANGLNPKAATALTDADRIAVTERITGRKLKPAESDAVIKAHNIDCGGFSVNNPCNSSKAIALRRAGFSPNETRDIMRMGVTGTQKAVPPIRVLTAAEKAAGKDKLIEEFGNVKITTPEQNAAFIKFVKTSTPDQVDRAFLVMDNTKLGEINNVTSNKLLANAVTNKQIARVQEAMSDLAASYRPTKIKFISATDDVKAVAVTPYSSFKSGAYGFVTETGEKLPDEFLNLVSNRMVTVNNEYYTYLRELDVLPPTIDPMFMFRSGLDRTYRDAEQAARQARTMSDINRPRSMMEAQIREQAETSFAFSQLAQKIHTNRLQGTDLVIKDIQSGNWVLSTKGLDLIKKAKSPDVLVSQIKQTTGVVVTEKQATLLFKHKADTDTYIPSTLVVNRESPVLDSIHGGINFDLVGAGAEGSFRSQLAVARSKNVDELFVNSEKGERAVTEILNDRRAAVRAATEPVMEKYGVKGRFVESGDDMAFVAENKPVPQAALDEVVRNLGKTKEPSKVRMSAVEGGIKTVETRMTIGTQGEAIEKSVRARLVGVLPKELEEKLFIGVKMETRELGTGSARLMIGSDVPITPFQRQQIERAFNQAAVEYKYKAVISPAPAVVDAGAASVLKNADEFISSYRSNGLDPAAATALTDADRIAVTERITGRKLKPAESDAVIKAHNIDCGGFSVNNPCNSSKAIALRRAGFSPEETKDIMQMGVAGRESTTVGSTVQDFRGRRDWTVAGEPPTNRAAGTATTVVDPQRRPAQFGTATTRENPADLWVRINEDFQNQAKALDMTLIPENRGAPNKLTPSNTLTSPVQPLTPATPLDTALATGKVVRERPLGLGGINDGKKIVQLEGGSYGVWKPHEEVWYSSYRSEVLAYEVDKKLGFNLVPPTVTRLIDGKVGSLQLWAPSSKTATATQTALDKQSTLDFLIDHGDRHGGNYLVRDDRSIISIDNGIAFNGNGMNVRTLKERLPEILRFAKTTEGKAIIERVRALQNDTRFRSQIESYIGAKDAQRMMDRIGFLLRAAKEASGGK